MHTQTTNNHPQAPVEQKCLYKVSANMDQLVKHNMVGGRTWTPHEKQPNSVHTLLPIGEARELYRTLKSKGMVAFRNWMDD
jgi:hypothetical protein